MPVNLNRRSAAFGFAAFLLLAVVAPVLAAPGGNSDASAACENGGYVNWTDSDGNAFRNEGACVRYAAHGGVLVPAEAQPFSVAYSSIGPSAFRAVFTGTGLEPSSAVRISLVWPNRSVTVDMTADASGSMSLTLEEQCRDAAGESLTSVTATGTPAGGSQTEYSLPRPDASICP
jgi:hypothetical protein